MTSPTEHSSRHVSIKQLFAYPFRIFFISVAAWAIIAIALWSTFLSGHLVFSPALPFMQWHQHEMLFGFLNPAIAGFLLTAVCVWTKTERMHGGMLIGLWLVWLAGRLVLLFGENLPELVVQGVNLAFLPLVAFDAGRRIWSARQSRHIVILIVLGLLWGMQIGVLVSSSTFIYTQGALILIATLMLIIGGRITPAFSAGWLRQHGGNADAIRTFPWLEKIVLASMFLLLAATLADYKPGATLMAFIAAIVSLVRLVFWRGWLVKSEPLLWILHLSLLWVPLSLLLLAGHHLGVVPKSAWIHALGIGAMSSLILGVMTRVALGHTGRPLQLPRGIVSAYVLIQLGALVRVATATNSLPWKFGIEISAVCFITAFTLFIWRYSLVLLSPRVDGKPG